MPCPFLNRLSNSNVPIETQISRYVLKARRRSYSRSVVYVSPVEDDATAGFKCESKLTLYNKCAFSNKKRSGSKESFDEFQNVSLSSKNYPRTEKNKPSIKEVTSEFQGEISLTSKYNKYSKAEDKTKPSIKEVTDAFQGDTGLPSRNIKYSKPEDKPSIEEVTDAFQGDTGLPSNNIKYPIPEDKPSIKEVTDEFQGDIGLTNTNIKNPTTENKPANREVKPSITNLFTDGSQDVCLTSKNNPITEKKTETFSRPVSSANHVGSSKQNIFRNKAKGRSFNYDYFFYTKVMQKKKDHLFGEFKQIHRLASQFPTGFEYTHGEQPINIWSSNDSLGMTGHPFVKVAVQNALELYGAGAGGTRNMSGNSLLHDEFEKELAALHHKEAALLFTSCSVANDSTLCTLAKAIPGCHIFCDEGSHLSVIDGIQFQVPKHIFRHNDPVHLAQLLTVVGKSTPKIVALETIYSMTGEVCPLKLLLDVSHSFGALVFVDEVHAVGIYGKNGAGIGDEDDLLDQMDIISGTLGEAFGNVGGYIAGSRFMVDMVRSYATGFLHTTSLPPTVIAGARAAVKVLTSLEGDFLRKSLKTNVKYLKYKLVEKGIPAKPTSTHIIPILVGDPLQCTKISDRLLKEKGHYLQAINYPTVPKGQEILCLIPTSHHTTRMIDNFIDDLLAIWISQKLPLKA